MANVKKQFNGNGTCSRMTKARLLMRAKVSAKRKALVPKRFLLESGEELRRTNSSDLSKRLTPEQLSAVKTLKAARERRDKFKKMLYSMNNDSQRLQRKSDLSDVGRKNMNPNEVAQWCKGKISSVNGPVAMDALEVMEDILKQEEEKVKLAKQAMKRVDWKTKVNQPSSMPDPVTSSTSSHSDPLEVWSDFSAAVRDL